MARQRRFRSSLVLAPAAMILCIILLLQVKPAFTFGDLADRLGARVPEYARLGAFAAALIGVTLLVRLFRNR